jgi:hypothetical protein
MRPGAALAAAAADFYHQSWRFFLLNAAFSAIAGVVVVAGFWAPAAWMLLPAAGSLAAALMHCAVVTTVTGELRLRHAVDGLRLHWRRGLLLGAVLAICVLAAVQAITFYASRDVLVLAVVGVYLAAMFAVFQLVLWPLAVFEFELPVRRVAANALRALLERPIQALLLAAALLAVNVAGLAAAVVPFLTLTIGYSFLAAAHFALPPTVALEGGDQWPR